MIKRSISCVVIAYDMDREIARTIHSLSSAGQRGIASTEYEIIVVDNGSPKPLHRDQFPAEIDNLRVVRMPVPHPSPANALNYGASLATGDIIVSMIDGARMASPGCLRWISKAFDVADHPIAIVTSWHIGPDVQNVSIEKGYNQAVEDRLLASINWQGDGYELFAISKELDPSSGPAAWFKPIAESNMIAVSRSDYVALGGFDEAFSSAGGGAVNLDFFRRAVEHLARPVVSIFGEGTFHQFHGGVSTNVKQAEHPWTKIHDEYRRIRGCDYACPTYEAVILGQLGPSARNWLASNRNIINHALRPSSFSHRVKEAVRVMRSRYTYHPTSR